MAKLVNVRERMDPEGERCMQGWAVLIERNVEANDITAHLYSRFVLSLEDKNEIENEKNKLKRIRLLTSRIITHGGSDAFPAFLEALKSARYDSIRNKLCETIESKQKLPEIIPKSAGNKDKFNNEWTRRKTVESKMNFLRTKVTELESKFQAQALKSKKQHETVMRAIEDIKSLIQESVDTTKAVTELEKQLKLKELKLKSAEEKIKQLEEKLKRMEAEQEEDRGKIKNLEGKVKQNDEEIADLKVREELKDAEIADLQKNQKSNEERIQMIEKMIKEQNRKPPALAKAKFVPQNRFQPK